MSKKKNPETPEVETTETVEQEPKQETKAKEERDQGREEG